MNLDFQRNNTFVISATLWEQAKANNIYALIFSACACCIAYTDLVLVLWTIVEQRFDVRDIVWIILVTLVCACTTLTGDCVIHVATREVCSTLNKVILTSYAWEHIMYYFVLLKRMDATKQLVKGNKTFDSLRRMASIITGNSIIFIVVTTFLVRSPGTVAINEITGEAHCYTSTFTVMIIGFGISDVMLSMLYLYLFLMPLRAMVKIQQGMDDSFATMSNHEHVMSTQHSNSVVLQLRGIARHNLVMSSIHIAISIGVYAGTSVVNYLSYPGGPEELVNPNWLNYFLIIGGIEAVMVPIFLWFLTNAWKPRWVIRFQARVKRKWDRDKHTKGTTKVAMNVAQSSNGLSGVFSTQVGT